MVIPQIAESVYIIHQSREIILYKIIANIVCSVVKYSKQEEWD